ncbi:MAG: 4-vinyl reductase, partial [Desulfurococcaceae archaeon]
DHYPVVVVDERALIFRKEMMNIMLLGIREKWGATGQVFLYFLGYEGGVGAAKFYKRVSELPPLEAVKASLKVAMAHGLGMFELVSIDLDKPLIAVRAYDLFECSPVKGKREEPFSEFYRGVLSGTFSELLGVKVSAEERRCIAKGDPYCEFIITKEESSEA